MLSSQTSLKPVYNKSYALIIGINKYQYVPPLKHATNDASLIYETLTDNLGFPNAQVFLLKDEKATKKEIMDCFLNFVNIANDPDDRLIVFFAGHGFTMPGLRGETGFLVPVDGDLKNLNSLVRWDDLTRNSDLILAKHILFIMDACYSGLAIQRGLPPGSQRFLSNMIQRIARQVITAGKADEQVSDGGGPSGKNSIFTGYLIEGMKGEASDENGIITANGLMNYVYRKVGSDNRSRQTPHFGYIEGDGDFIIKTPDMSHLSSENFKDIIVKTKVIQQDLDQQGSLIRTQDFAIRNGYTDPSHPAYGHNDWTEKLGEFRYGDTHEIAKAFSWFGIVVEPQATNNDVIFNFVKNREKYRNWKNEGVEPYNQFRLPSDFLTTSDTLVFYEKIYPDQPLWRTYLRMQKQGNLEYTESFSVFTMSKELRSFHFVNLIGLTWQFINFSRTLLGSENYREGVKILINLIGTKDSILDDFSKEEGKDKKHWVNLTDRSHWFDLNHINGYKCQEHNLKFEYNVVLSDLDEDQIKAIIVDLAQQLSLAFNHQSEPRCFNFETTDFPWRQFFSSRRWN